MAEKQIIVKKGAMGRLRLAGIEEGPGIEVQAGCLTDRQVARMAVDPSGSPTAEVYHAAHCDACIARVAESRVLLRGMRREGRFRKVVERAKAAGKVAACIGAGVLCVYGAYTLGGRVSMMSGGGASIGGPSAIVADAGVYASDGPYDSPGAAPGTAPFLGGLSPSGGDAAYPAFGAAIPPPTGLARGSSSGILMPISYRAGRGETWASICLAFYRDATLADALREYNRRASGTPAIITESMTIRLPTIEKLRELSVTGGGPRKPDLKSGRVPTAVF
ncbi:MAG: hypothetical protein HRU70_07820 [Phycisphaeraceae bacterium]|nr:MAG: hypothetical protein HRU70_07820 [Phycisphaeraceae bacterium]